LGSLLLVEERRNIMPADQGILDSVTNVNTKTLGDGPAFYTNMQMANSVSHQQALNQIGQAALGAIVDKLINVDVPEAVGLLKASGGVDPGVIMALATALGGAQVATKTAQTTPPPTP
jgi:hypothetical protein